jgi:hypothetical protein
MAKFPIDFGFWVSVVSRAQLITKIREGYGVKTLCTPYGDIKCSFMTVGVFVFINVRLPRHFNISITGTFKSHEPDQPLFKLHIDEVTYYQLYDFPAEVNYFKTYKKKSDIEDVIAVLKILTC